MFGASNELPEGKELEALFDRFLLRCEVGISGMTFSPCSRFAPLGGGRCLVHLTERELLVELP